MQNLIDKKNLFIENLKNGNFSGNNPKILIFYALIIFLLSFLIIKKLSQKQIGIGL